MLQNSEASFQGMVRQSKASQEVTDYWFKDSVGLKFN